MSTNAMIGYKCADGKIRASYCHWDGYCEGVGSMLVENYNSEAKASQFASMRQMAVLKENYLNCEFYNEPTEDNTYESLGDFSDAQEYNYLWMNGRWYISSEETNNRFLDLEQFV